MNQYADDVDQLPYFIEIHRQDGRRIVICHAEFPLAQWSPDTIASNPELMRKTLWSRDKVLTGDESLVEGIDYVICGHTIVKKPVVLGNTWFIDTGAYASQCLTVLPLAELP